MSSDPLRIAREIFADSVTTHRAFAEQHLDTVVRAAEVIRRALDEGHIVYAFGNGGSASDAQHLVAELIGRFEVERPGLAAVALTPDSNVVTAIANDFGYDVVFARQIDALGRPGDVAVGISTSGKSPNVAMALARAREKGLTTVALTGRDGGTCGSNADIHINVPVQSTARIQEVHRTLMHALCAIVDSRRV